MLTIGIIGCGWHSRATHGPCLKQYKETIGGIRLAACCDLDGEAAEAYRADFGFERAYTSCTQMLESEQLDAVWVIVPEHLTVPISLQVMHAGIAVFLEKPPGVNTSDVIQLQETAAKKGIRHRVAFNRRYVPMTATLIEKLRAHVQEQDKEIYSITYDMIRINRTDADFSTTAIHAIDAAKFIAGSDYESLRFQYDDLSGIAPGLINIMAEGNFRSGVRVQLNCYPYSGSAREMVTVRGEGFSYELHLPLMESLDSFAGLICSEKGKVEVLREEREWTTAFGFYHENASFLDALKSGGNLTEDLSSSIQSVAVMEAIRNRAETYHG
ncbi:Gfo/Idh/MocA family protein [Paenibacillus sp. CF384]|uniref:Gfo/Idh/MocA family protein n=1 Tax=Paenibacillus sp. CF384 TaxID=1884382 RepID=UPI00089D2928|nr:Gfo/Idh/MocA family oxidoreductase [Paenibacillus sp. CF384]SDW17509.1 Predicted dehydrogenase [Paenibacillus sp. CF384]